MRKHQKTQALLKIEKLKKGYTSGLEETWKNRAVVFFVGIIRHSEANLIVHFPFYAETASLTQCRCCV